MSLRSIMITVTSASLLMAQDGFAEDVREPAEPATLATLSFIARAAEPPISKDRIAALFDYPVTALNVTDSTEAANKTAARKGRPLVDSSHVFTANDHSFAPLGIVVAGAGKLLTQELRDYYHRALASPVGPQTGFQKISFADLGDGVVGPGIVGPGGYTLVATITVPSVGKDVRVALTVSRDGQSVRAQAAERHHALLMQSTELTERLVQCVKIAAQAVASFGKAPKQASTNMPSNSPGNAMAAAPPAAVSNSSRLDSDWMPSWWLILAALGLAVVVVFFIYRKRRRRASNYKPPIP